VQESHSSETLFLRCIVQPRTPFDHEDIAPKKQTIRNALRDPKDTGNYDRPRHGNKMPIKTRNPKWKKKQANLFRG
jgi:hypothetical protein